MTMASRAARITSLSFVLAAVACGGEASPPPTSAPEAPPSTATSAGSHSRRSRYPEGPFTGPEFDGDHSVPGDPVAGEAVFRANCIACHGADGRGNGGLTGANFIDDHSRLAKNNDTLIHSITVGIPNSPPMPAHQALLTETQIRDALSYVRVHFGGSPAPTPAADPTAAPAAPPGSDTGH